MQGGDETAMARVFISGRVQGVFFRARTQEEACRRNLSGWVRNCPDGRVEALFEGPKREVVMILDWCRQGPPAAHVTSVEIEWGAPSGAHRGFSIRR